MLPEFGWTELLMIGIVLIVVIGPKDLPRVVKGFSKGLKSARKMSDDFRKQFSDAMDEADLTEMRELASDMKSLDPRSQIKDALAPLSKLGADVTGDLKEAAEELEAPSIHPLPEFKPALDKPPSVAEQALASSGEKAKAAQPKKKAPEKAKARPDAEVAGDVPADVKQAPDVEPLATPTTKPATRKAPAKKAPAKTAAAAKKPAARKRAAKKTTAKKTTTTKTAAAKKAAPDADDAA